MSMHASEVCTEDMERKQMTVYANVMRQGKCLFRSNACNDWGIIAMACQINKLYI